MPINEAQKAYLDELIKDRNSDYVANIFNGDLDKGVIHLFLERAITENRVNFLNSLDKLAATLQDDDKKLPILSAFKTLNDLHTNSCRSLEREAGPASLEFHFKSLQGLNEPVDIQAFQGAIRKRITGILHDITREVSSEIVMQQCRAFEDRERGIVPDASWRREFMAQVNQRVEPAAEPTWNPYNMDINFARQQHANPLRQDAGMTPLRVGEVPNPESDHPPGRPRSNSI